MHHNVLTQTPGSMITLTPKPAFNQVDMVLNTRDHGRVVISLDESSLARYTPWFPDRDHVVVPRLAILGLCLISAATSLSTLIMALIP